MTTVWHIGNFKKIAITRAPLEKRYLHENCYVDRFEAPETFLTAGLRCTQSKMTDGRHIGKIIITTHVAKIVDTPNENLILQSKTCNSYLNCVFFTQTA